MRRFIIKRLLLLIPMLLGIILIIFFISSLSPTSPGRLILGPNVEQELVDKLNAKLGYDRPFLVRYADYIAHMVRGDFGRSYYTEKPVFDVVFERLPVTFRLAVFSLILSCLIGIPIGVLSAVKQYSIWDYLGTTLAMFLSVIPGFWFALVLLLFFTLNLGILPSSGASTWQHFVMPVIVTAIASMALLMRMTRTTMLEAIRQDYIRTARAKGASEKTVIWKHALRNALLPVVTLIGVYFGVSMGGTVITEMIFTMPGLGTLVIESVRKSDTPQVLAIVILLSIFFMLVMLLVDILYAYLDPRIKSVYEAKETIAVRKGRFAFFRKLINRFRLV